MNTDIWVQIIASIEAVIVVLIPIIISICGRKSAEKPDKNDQEKAFSRGKVGSGKTTHHSS